MHQFILALKPFYGLILPQYLCLFVKLSLTYYHPISSSISNSFQDQNPFILFCHAHQSLFIFLVAALSLGLFLCLLWLLLVSLSKQLMLHSYHQHHLILPGQLLHHPPFHFQFFSKILLIKNLIHLVSLIVRNLHQSHFSSCYLLKNHLHHHLQLQLCFLQVFLSFQVKSFLLNDAFYFFLKKGLLHLLQTH